MLDTAVSVRYAEERLTQPLADELSDTLADHYANTLASDGVPPFDFNWRLYSFLQEQGSLLITTARAPELVAFAMYLLSEAPHHIGMKVAECDTILTVHHRKGEGIGSKLYEFSEVLLRRRGIERIVQRYRVVYDEKPVFEKLGFKLEEHVYIKRL